MKLSRRIPSTGPLAGSISRTSFEVAVNSGRLVKSIPQIQKHILAKYILITKKNNRKGEVCCFVCSEKTTKHCSCCTIGPKDTPVLFVISIVSRQLSSTEN